MYALCAHKMLFPPKMHTCEKSFFAIDGSCARSTGPKRSDKWTLPNEVKETNGFRTKIAFCCCANRNGKYRPRHNRECSLGKIRCTVKLVVQEFGSRFIEYLKKKNKKCTLETSTFQHIFKLCASSFRIDGDYCFSLANKLWKNAFGTRASMSSQASSGHFGSTIVFAAQRHKSRVWQWKRRGWWRGGDWYACIWRLTCLFSVCYDGLDICFAIQRTDDYAKYSIVQATECVYA